MTRDAPERLVRLEVADGGMAAVVTLEPGIDPGDLNEHTLLSLLRERGVRINARAERRAAEAVEAYRAAPGERLRTTLAAGTPPRHGVDGRIRFAPGLDPDEEEAAAGAAEGAAAPEGGRSDGSGGSGGGGGGEEGSRSHYTRSSVRTVRAGQVIGTIVPPTDGEDGVDVFGKKLAAKAGVAAGVRLDESVMEQAGGELVAAHAGALEYRRPLLRVVRDLHIAGYVDFSTGNIDFPGDLTVDRGVRDCFDVRVAGSMTIHGLVEAASLHAGVDASLPGGMAAREKGMVSVGRDLHAKHLANVRCFVGRDLTVEKEIVNGQTIVGRRFHGERCAVTGGVLIMAHACVLGQLGSASGVATGVVLGRIPELEDLAGEAGEVLGLLEARAVRAQERLDTLRKAAGKARGSQVDELTELEFVLGSARQKLAQLNDRIAKIREMVGRHASADLVVHRRLFAGVKLWLGVHVAEIGDDLRGPVRIFVDDRGAPQLTDLSSDRTRPLASVARVLAYEGYTGPTLDGDEPALKAA